MTSEYNTAFLCFIRSFQIYFSSLDMIKQRVPLRDEEVKWRTLKTERDLPFRIILWSDYYDCCDCGDEQTGFSRHEDTIRYVSMLWHLECYSKSL